MYVGPWQEFKLMHLIGAVKAENEQLRRHIRASGEDGNGGSLATPVSSTGSTAGAQLRAQRPQGGTGPGPRVQNLGASRYAQSSAASVASDRDAPQTPSEASIRSAPARVGQQQHYGGGGTSSSASAGGPSAREILDTLVHGPPRSHDLEARARVRRPQLRNGGRTVDGGAGGGDDERARRRAMLSMLYAGDAGSGDSEVAREIEAAEAAIHERRQQRGRAGGPSSVARRAAAEPSQRAVGLVNRNVMRDLHTHSAAVTAGSAGAFPPPTRVPWDTFAPVVAVTAATAAAAGPARGGGGAGAAETSPTVRAFLAEQEQRFAGAARQVDAVRAPGAVGAPSSSIAVQRDEHRHRDAVAVQRARRPYDVGAPIYPSAASDAAPHGSSTAPVPAPPPMDAVQLAQLAPSAPPDGGLSPPRRPLRTEAHSGWSSTSPDASGRRPMSTATDASLDLDVGGLLQWTTSLGQRDSWGRLPGDAHYGLGHA